METTQSFNERTVFNFALRFFYELHPGAITRGVDDSTDDALRMVAEGKLLLMRSPEEMAKDAAPHRRGAIEAELRSSFPEMIEQDKAIAARILAP